VVVILRVVAFVIGTAVGHGVVVALSAAIAPQSNPRTRVWNMAMAASGPEEQLSRGTQELGGFE